MRFIVKHPFRQKRENGKLIREFSKDVDSSELVWHRDRADRYVRVRRGKGWQLQLENKLPVYLVPGKTYYIPQDTYHRVIKGSSRLIVEIKEKSSSMKITKRQLKRIIREKLETKFRPVTAGPQRSTAVKQAQPELQAASDAMSEVVNALWGQWDDPPDPMLLKKAQELHKEIKEKIR